MYTWVVDTIDVYTRMVDIGCILVGFHALIPFLLFTNPYISCSFALISNIVEKRIECQRSSMELPLKPPTWRVLEQLLASREDRTHAHHRDPCSLQQDVDGGLPRAQERGSDD